MARMVHNPVFVANNYYFTSTNARSLAFNHNYNSRHLIYWMNTGTRTMTISGFIKFGPAASSASNYDFAYITANGWISGKYVCLQLNNGTNSTYAVRLSANPGGSVSNSSSIPVTPGGTYWITMRLDYTGGTARLAVYETSGWTQIGNVSVNQPTGEDIERIRIGNNGFGISSGKTSYFDHLCFDKNNAAFPFGP
jgi:hypothetical protein